LLAALPILSGIANVGLDCGANDGIGVGLEEVTPELYQTKCSGIFEHFYESYPDRDVNIYAQAVGSHHLTFEKLKQLLKLDLTDNHLG